MTPLQRLPIRWRLGVISAGLTFVILLLFAVVMGVFTVRQVRSSFDDDVRLTAVQLQERIVLQQTITGLQLRLRDQRDFVRAATAGGAAVRIVRQDGKVMVPDGGGPDLGLPREGVREHNGYRVIARPLRDAFGQPIAYLQYAKPVDHLQETVHRVKLFLIVGVLAGTVLALLAGLALARRAMAPIAALTHAAKGITRTRDPGVSLPKPPAEDEIADLARTLEDMLMALDAARAETEAALDRQREFVADASHELRTPLTSILANLELLEAHLDGEEAEMAGSALRSSRRMRRLVADLLLLARADAGRRAARGPVDLRAIVREAAAEAAAVADDHLLSVDIGDAPLVVDGAPDDLHRLVQNLVQNALMHTPAGTSVSVAARRDGDVVVVDVADDGPGVAPELRERIFDRFVRGAGDCHTDAGGGSGLGLAIVRAVAEGHGGTVELAGDGGDGGGGTRFTVRLPLAVPAPAARPEVRPPLPPAAPSAAA